MTYQKRVLCAAVIASLGFAAGSASAFDVVDLTATTPGPSIKVFSGIPSTVTQLGEAGNGTIEVKLKTPAGATPTNTNPVYIKVNLNNGAKFSDSLTMSCSGLTSGAAGESSTTAGDFLLQAGGNGFSNVTFQLTAINGATGTFDSNSFCTLSAGSGITISGLSNVTVSGTYEYTDGLQQTSAAGGVGTLISFVDPLRGVYSASTATTALVDATSGSDNWVNGNNLASINTAILGFVSYGTTGASALTAALSANADLGDALGAASGSITISGPAIAALKTVGSSRGVYLASAAACGTQVTTGYTSTGTNSVTFAGLTTANVTGGVYVCGVVSGNTTQISTGQLTGVHSGGLQTSVSITFPSPGNIQNIGSNGTTKNAYLVHAASSTTKTSVVRVVNNGANSGSLFATAYDEAGAVCGTASSLLGTINVGQMLTFRSTDLETTLGCTPSASSAKYRVVFFGGLTSFKILNHAKDTTGTGFTLSQSQDD